MRRLALAVAGGILLASNAGILRAQAIVCTTTLANANGTTIQTAINSASPGAVICLPAGSFSGNWTVSKSVTVIGAALNGIGGTTATTGNFTVNDNLNNWRIAGITFNMLAPYHQVGPGTGWRIDHNSFSLVTFDWCFLFYGTASPTEGLLDHNTFNTCTMVQFGGAAGAGQKGQYRWAEAENGGTSHAIYAEDNTFNLPNGSSGGNQIDGNWGSRWVVRFNAFHNQRIEAHSVQADNARAARWWEIYNNTLDGLGATSRAYRPFLIRGGSGRIFHNTYDGSYTISSIIIDNDRSHECSIATAGQCGSGGNNQVPSWGMCGWKDSLGGEQPNGYASAFIDGTTAGARGYPCRDQIGRGIDASQWNSSYTNPAPTQALSPAYIWKNTNTKVPQEMPIALNCENSGIPCSHQATYHIVANRDYYAYAPSFNGTAGVGEGVLASRPATCTKGVGYWATDQGEWNATQAGNDGQLYVCSATNTWSLYYIPYSYPHPLQSGVATPQNLRVL